MRVSTLLFAAAPLWAVLAAEPVSIWHFDEGEGGVTFDATKLRQAKLIRQPQATQWVEGKSGKAIQITGKYTGGAAGGIGFSIPPETFLKPFTLELWFKLNDGDPSYTHYLAGNGSDCGPGFKLSHEYNAIYITTGDGTKYQKKGSPRDIIIPVKIWCFLAMTYDGKQVAVYVNGSKIIDEAMTLTKGNNRFTLGALDYGYAYPLMGAIDEFKLYNYARTPEEITQAYTESAL